MAADIDDFIRNQKQRMQFERQRLVPGPVNSGGGPPAPIRPQDRVGAILKEDVPHPEDMSRGVGMSVESKKALIDGRDGGAALPGLGERQYGGPPQTRTRNQDYNAFKAAEEAKFQNRFANRKTQPAPQHPPHAATLAQQYQNAIPAPQPPQPPQPQFAQMPPPVAPQVPPQSFHNGQFDPFPLGPAGREEPPAAYDRKLMELERTVADLREQMSRRGPQPVPGPAPAPPRQGWATPDYNDLVAAKRKEEARRHRLEDPELYGALMTDHDRRFEDPYDDNEDLDAQLNSQKVHLISRRDGRAGRRLPVDILEDNDAWLRVGAIPDLDGSLKNLEGRLQAKTQGRNAPGPGTHRRRGPGQSGARGDNTAALGSLPVGQEERVSAKQRRQGSYREELQRQMAEQQAAKQRERKERLAPPKESGGQSQAPAATPRRAAPTEVSQLPSMPLQPGLDNLPSLSAYNTPADDAYFYYGSKNPLEDTLEESLPSQQPFIFQPPPQGPPGPARGDETSRKENRQRMQGISSENPLARNQAGDPREAERRKKVEYAAELQRQMQEVAKNKALAKKEQEEYDRRKDAEIAEYFPFESRSGGGGEPIKRNGEVVADLRKQGGGGGGGGLTARTEVNESFKLQLSGSFGADALQNSTRRDPGSQRTPRTQTNAHGDVTHARGGHGVFGQPKSEEEKAKTDNYKEQLRLQIEERKRQKEEEAEKQRLQEEKEQKKIEDQARRIREEFEEEQRRQKEKREEVNRKNEEMWQQAEAKKRQEAEAKRRRTADNAERPPFQPQGRVQSPPIPALRKQPGNTPRAQSPPLPTHQRQQRVIKSPPTSRPPLPGSSRRESTGGPDVLRQLERMKKELQTERVKVEDALRGTPPPNRPQQAESGRYEVIPTSARGRRSRAEDLDVFELARQGRSGPVVVRTQRPRGDLANTDVLREFRNLKLRDNEVGKEVRKEHPATPLTSDLLEVQQNTYLRQQENFIRDMQRRPLRMERYETPQPRADPTPRRLTAEQEEVASQYSFDVENLNQRTEERMRRLSRLNADEVSLQNQDAVLESFMRQRTHVTNEAEREPERVVSVRNRETSYDLPTHGVKQTSFGGLRQDERTTSYHAPTPEDGGRISGRPPTVDLESVASDGGPTPVDDTWLNPKHRR